jgi:hypothetical protein
MRERVRPPCPSRDHGNAAKLRQHYHRLALWTRRLAPAQCTQRLNVRTPSSTARSAPNRPDAQAPRVERTVCSPVRCENWATAVWRSEAGWRCSVQNEWLACSRGASPVSGGGADGNAAAVWQHYTWSAPETGDAAAARDDIQTSSPISRRSNRGWSKIGASTLS